MADHFWTRSHVDEYVDGELDSRQAARVARHEGECEDCSRSIAALRRMLAALPMLRSGFAEAGSSDRVKSAVVNRISEF